MKINSSTIPNFVNRVLLSGKFFIFSLALFSIHTIWLALSAHSLPYDEYYHLGVIEFYSHRLSPFFSSQPASVSYLGDITRTPSYLYAYLVSWPYRFFALLTNNQYALTVLMRGLNIVLVIVGLIIWRKFLFKLGVSRRLSHLTLFVFMLLPLIVMVAAESNYDNLLFVLTPIFLGFSLSLAKGSINLKNVVGFVCLGLISCLVKNQFVVIFGLTTLLVGATILNRHGLKSAVHKLHQSIKTSSRLTLITLSLISIVSFGLFIERYGVNAVRYHSINVDCARVQPFEVCNQFSPWQRNYNTIKDKSPNQVQLFGNPVSYTQRWIAIMMRGFYANFANVPQLAQPWDPHGTYKFKPVLPLMIYTSYLVLILTVVCLVVSFKKWWSVDWIRLSLLLIFSYLAILWLFNYSSYLSSGQAYAIQPRYLYPLLILLLASSAKVIQMTIKNPKLASWLAVVVIAIFIYCGGAIGWFLYAQSTWYWPNRNIVNVNHTVQNVLIKTIIRRDEKLPTL
ncbi:MAG: hypothetical protein ACXWLH_02920 [Candidatus Saccharimonadales bacterium]